MTRFIAIGLRSYQTWAMRMTLTLVLLTALVLLPQRSEAFDLEQARPQLFRCQALLVSEVADDGSCVRLIEARAVEGDHAPDGCLPAFRRFAEEGDPRHPSFVIHGVAKKYNVSMATIYRGIIPFVIVEILVIFLLTIFPEITLWLPNSMDVLAPLD